jgi:hypothetical protein
MTTRKLAAGDIVEARCTRCRTLTNHTIVAMVGSVPARVECNTCRGTHNYHAPKPEKAPKAAKATAAAKTPRAPRAGSAASAASLQRDWAESVSGADKAKVRPYSMQGSFPAGCLMQHPSFGLGLVRKQVDANKIECLFESGIKLLRCG